MSEQVAAGNQERPVGRTASPSVPRAASGFALKLYKPGQGYYTRIGTAIGVGVLAVFGTQFLKNQLEATFLMASSGGNGNWRLPLLYGIPTLFLIVMGVVIYWVVGLSRKANDFFIATEGEMKKVSWSTRAEVIRSTRVVIVAVVLLAAFLFVFDIVFMLFFGFINVLKVRPPWLDHLLGVE